MEAVQNGVGFAVVAFLEQGQGMIQKQLPRFPGFRVPRYMDRTLRDGNMGGAAQLLKNGRIILRDGLRQQITVGAEHHRRNWQAAQVKVFEPQRKIKSLFAHCLPFRYSHL